MGSFGADVPKAGITQMQRPVVAKLRVEAIRVRPVGWVH